MAFNDIRSLHSLNGNEWQRMTKVPVIKQSYWTALPLNVIKG